MEMAYIMADDDENICCCGFFIFLLILWLLSGVLHSKVYFDNAGPDNLDKMIGFYFLGFGIALFLYLMLYFIFIIEASYGFVDTHYWSVKNRRDPWYLSSTPGN